MCRCTWHAWYLVCSPQSCLSTVWPHRHPLAHAHNQTRAHTESNRPIRRSQCSNSLITFSTPANPPAFHPSCNSPKEQDSFHTANGYRKGNIFILIIHSTQGFIWYSPTLCPFIVLNDGQYLKREYWRRGRKSPYTVAVSLPSRAGDGRERRGPASSSPSPLCMQRHALLFLLGGRAAIYCTVP